MMNRLLAIAFSIFSLTSFSQKEANIWHFGHYVGLDFNTGSPVVIEVPFFTSNPGNATISDSLGNLLFSCGNNRIWNRTGGVMINGNELEGVPGAAQFALIIKKPSSTNLYYVFTIAPPQLLYPSGIWYSLVNMDLDGGLGAVTNEKNIPLDAAYDARDKQIGLKVGENIKIITYKDTENEYAVFTLSAQGIDKQPIISESIQRKPANMASQMKLSYNKKYLVTAFTTWYPNSKENAFEICKLDELTGAIEVLYTICHLEDEWPNSVEFSPDSKFLYLCSGHSEGVDNYN